MTLQPIPPLRNVKSEVYDLVNMELQRRKVPSDLLAPKLWNLMNASSINELSQFFPGWLYHLHLGLELPS